MVIDSGFATPYIRYLNQHPPDFVFFVASVKSGRLFLRLARKRGRPTYYVGSTSYEALRGDSTMPDSVFFPTMFPARPTTARASVFARSFEQAYGRPPESGAALGYDAVNLIAAAVRARGPHRKAVREYLASRGEHPVPGITGPIAFDSAGSRSGIAPVLAPLREVGAEATPNPPVQVHRGTQ
jgi:ABC-type branched-subunit amino acid transport system substrate-binding protein